MPAVDSCNQSTMDDVAPTKRHAPKQPEIMEAHQGNAGAQGEQELAKVEPNEIGGCAPEQTSPPKLVAADEQTDGPAATDKISVAAASAKPNEQPATDEADKVLHAAGVVPCED